MQTLKSTERSLILLLAIWGIVVLVSLFGRSYMPIDETRYVSVAWQMWLHGDFLVPHLNAQPYSHKPPLLFWLMQLGWKVFGVNDWWPRLLPSLFALGAILLTRRIAMRLWPQSPQTASRATIILIGCLLWLVFITATMFDMLVAFFTVLGVFALLRARQGLPRSGWLLFGLAIGGGLLAKGPVILLHLLPLALLAPWWARAPKLSNRSWYLGVLAALVIGIGLALLWAIPAGIHGGEKYQHEIFLGQTANRIANSFAHRKPLWWYLLLLPVILAPWVFAPPLWRALAKVRSLIQDEGTRLCLAWLLPVFVAFSLVSGKQMQYLLPLLPVFALLAARLLEDGSPRLRLDRLPLALLLAALGVFLLLLPGYRVAHDLPDWVANIPWWGGALLIAGALCFMLAAKRGIEVYLRDVALLSMLLVVTVYLAVIRQAGPAYDVREISAQLSRLQTQGVPLANACGKYYGQFDFVGRLRQSPQTVARPNVAAWFDAHPQGRVIAYIFVRQHVAQIRPDYASDYRGRKIAILDSQAWDRLQQLENDQKQPADDQDD